MSTKTKIAIITGGSRGLGRNMGISLAKKGIDIIFTYQSNITEAEKVVQEITSLRRRAKAIQLDIRQNSSFENFLIEVNTYLKQNYTGSKIDFLINNARIGLYAPVTEITEELADDLYHIHFKGVVLLTQKLLPYINNGGAFLYRRNYIICTHRTYLNYRSIWYTNRKYFYKMEFNFAYRACG